MTDLELRVISEVRDILSDPAELNTLKMRLADALLDLIKEDYRHKSEGGIGYGGLKWKNTKADHPIMMDSKRLFESLEVKNYPDGSIGVHFGIFPPQNKEDEGRLIALERRPAWPEIVPPSWITILNNLLAEMLGEMIRQRVAEASRVYVRKS